MKINIIDEISEFELKVSHKELRIIQEALAEYKPGFFIDDQGEYLDNMNIKMWDRDEFKSIKKIDKNKDKILNKISKVLTKINVW